MVAHANQSEAIKTLIPIAFSILDGATFIRPILYVDISMSDTVYYLIHCITRDQSCYYARGISLHSIPLGRTDEVRLLRCQRAVWVDVFPAFLRLQQRWRRWWRWIQHPKTLFAREAGLLTAQQVERKPLRNGHLRGDIQGPSSFSVSPEQQTFLDEQVLHLPRRHQSQVSLFPTRS